MDDVSMKVVIRVSDLAESRAFYADVLGLSVVDEWEEPHSDGCVLSFGSGFIELRDTPDGGRTAGDDADAKPKVDILLRVPDVDEWVARIDGRWKHGETKTQPWGERTVRMHDPDGILLTIYEETG